jgi:hypothetical protein
MAQMGAEEVPVEVPLKCVDLGAAGTGAPAHADAVRECAVHAHQDGMLYVVECKAAALIRDNADVAVEVGGAGATQCEGSMAAESALHIITSARHRVPHDGDDDGAAGAADVVVSLVDLEDTFALRKAVLRPWLTHELCLEMYGGDGEHFNVGAFVCGCTGGEPPLVR